MSSAVILDAASPFPRLVAEAQRAQRAGLTGVWIQGPTAPAVAARLQRVVRDVVVGVQAESTHDLTRLAIDLVALAAVAGGRTRVRVLDPIGKRQLAAVLQRQLAAGATGSCAYFGGDAFAVMLRMARPTEIEVHGVHPGDVTFARVAEASAVA